MILDAAALPIEQYHRSAPEWWSKTSLRYLAEYGPRWVGMWLAGQVLPRKPGGAEQGAALDCLLTEGSEAFSARYTMRPEGIDGRTKEGRAWAAGHIGKSILSSDDWTILADAAHAVRGCLAWPQIERARAQATIRRHSPALGLGLQSRPDWLIAEDGIVLDLKKTRDLARFGAQAIELGYHLQAAVAGWCLAGDGIPLEHAYLVAVEWERGARCRVYEIPHEVLAHADRQMRAVASEIADRLARGDWSDHQQAIEPLPLPAWVERQIEEAAV